MMDDLWQICSKTEKCSQHLDAFVKEFKEKMSAKLWGTGSSNNKIDIPVESLLTGPVASPRQTNKRAKRLSALAEDENEVQAMPRSDCNITTAKCVETSNVSDVIVEELAGKKCTKSAPTMVEHVADQQSNESSLMPPPRVSLAPSNVNVEAPTYRPQRAAKLKSEKLLKEPKLNVKMRAPSNSEKIKIKLEHEQRQSQIRKGSDIPIDNNNLPTHTQSDNHAVMSENELTMQSLSDVENNSKLKVTDVDLFENKKHSNNAMGIRPLTVRVKREKLNETNCTQSSSMDSTELNEKDIVTQESDGQGTKSLTSSVTTCNTSSSTCVEGNPKKARKKKDIALPRPIKVERFSLLQNNSPVALRTRLNSTNQKTQQTQDVKSSYENSTNNLSNNSPKKITVATKQVLESFADITTVNAVNQNETITVTASKSNETMILGDATFCKNSAQTTFQVVAEQNTFVVSKQNVNTTIAMDKQSDDAFNVAIEDTTDQPDKGQQCQTSFNSSRASMKTAKDVTHPEFDTPETEDESFVSAMLENQLPVPKAVPTKLPTPSKSYKLPARTKELFNPLVQSPVKLKVKAFENAASEQKRNTRPKRTKESPTSNLQCALSTPNIGKAHVAQTGRFLTPTQTSNITPNVMTQLKKGPNSASKAVPFPKSSASNLRSVNSNSSKTLSRENSTEDFRKGIHLLAEERKKQREYKHQMAAQQREARERERAERMAKLAKEREEKRLKKKAEAESRKRELEEIQRKLRLREEAEAEAVKAKAAQSKAIMDQERQLLQQMKQQKINAKSKMLPPPPPKQQLEYAFEMLHEYDSTDDEEKVSYKRPPPPNWSRSRVREEAIQRIQYCPTDIIDCFFSVQPLTPDLKQIFPNIDARQLKRNSSVFWSTPPRYSELPKY